MELIFVSFHKGQENILNIDMSFNWNKNKLPKDLNFREVYFAGELDKHAEVTLPELQAIYKSQWNPEHIKNKKLITYKNLKDLEYYMSQPELYDRIEIVLFQWSSGY
jgi:hypothetical protein